jgi:predicted GNAT family N-acyltransferase
MLFQIQETNDPKVIESIGRLRAEVWRSEQSVEFEEFGDSDCWLDDFDNHAVHWIVYAGNEIAAAARLSVHPCAEKAPYGHIFKSLGLTTTNVASINRLVVKQKFRGQGLSKLLDAARLQKARELGATAVLALPVGESRQRVLMREGFLSIAANVDPTAFDVKIKNAKLAVLSAPLQCLDLPA